MSILEIAASRDCNCGLAFEFVWHEKLLMPNNYSYEIVY